MLKLDYGKYRGIIISVALFLLLDASVLLLNFYVSFEIADDAVGVNLAGRQRMLSQRMAKTLFVLDATKDDPVAFKTAFDELQLSQKLFDETLSSFIKGGSVRGAGTETVTLEAVSNTAGKQSLSKAVTLWQPYKEAINTFTQDVNDKNDHINSLAAAVTMARTHNLSLLGLMNELTMSLEQVAASKATRLRTIQTVGISLAILNFLFIMLHFVRQLRESDAIIEKARNETTEILQTVNEGLFLIDSQLIIGEQHSAKLGEILGQTTFGGQSFQALLSNIINEKDAETARAFIELLFDPKIKEKLIGDLNPLNLVEVNIAQDSGGFLTKYLTFKFARAYHNSRISHVLVTVLDITEQVKLEKALNESRKNNESQLEMLTSLLHTHPSLLKEFIANSYECFNSINNILRLPAKTTQAVREKVALIFKEIHNFKGEAASLKLEYFENHAHAIEDSLDQLRQKRDLSGNDYLGLTVQLENLINYTQQVEQLTEKLGQFAMVKNTEPTNIHAVITSQSTNISSATNQAHPSNHDWGNLQELVQNVAARNGKLVKLVTSGLQEVALAPDYQQRIKEICIQLLRNAVVHGIESPTDRELSEKPLQGRIDVRLAKISESEMELTVMDDGQGLDYDGIREKAIQSQRWSPDLIESWGNKQLLGLIFNDGFSTAKDISKDAGRGVGMDLVMGHVLQHRGKITVSSRRGRHCRFVITLPIIRDQIEIAA